MIYSVYWDEERVTVVDAQGAEAVEALILRHQCDDDDCAHCDLFSFAEGIDDNGMKPVPITAKGYVLRPPWWSPLELPMNIRTLFLRPIVARFFSQEPHAYWPPHP